VTVLDHPFTNDDVAHAVDVPGVPFRARTDTTGATREPADPRSCALVGGTVWYRYAPRADTNVFADTFGTGYAVALAAFTGATQPVQPAGCNSSATGNAQLGLAARGGETYWFQITGPAGGGPLAFDLVPMPRTSLGDVSTTNEKADAAYPGIGVSRDGRFIVFQSYATNLAGPGSCPSGSCTGIFVRDRVAGTTALVISRPTTKPLEGAGGSLYPDVAESDLWDPQITPDGRFVTFASSAALIPEDTNRDFDVYLVDRATGSIERESVASDGHQGTTPPAHDDRTTPDSMSGSKYPAISDDGRYVVFASDAPDLVDGDANGDNDVFVHDRLTGRTELVSIDPSGSQMPGALVRFGRSMSPDGRFVAFWGLPAKPLLPTTEPLPHDTARQVFMRDRLLGTTTLASPSTRGGGGALDSYDPAVSADGRYVSFISEASDLVPDDTNSDSCTQVAETTTCGTDEFRFDLATRRMLRVSVSSSGEQQVLAPDQVGQSSDYNYVPSSSMSEDGRWVSYRSNATNLVPGDPDGRSHIYLHDCVTGATTRASVSSAGEPGNDDSMFTTISGDGSVVAFISMATNLAPEDHDSSWDIYLHERE
jgi:Tol biopolymer transport system component